MSALVKDNRQDPPGVLPRKLKQIGVALIAGIVFLSSMFSGENTKEPKAPNESAPTRPTQSQMTAFSQMLERTRKESEAARKHQEELRERLEGQLATRSSQPVPTVTPVSPEDPLRQAERARAARAPFASSVVLRPSEPQETVGSVEPTPQLVLRVERTASRQEPRAEEVKPVAEGSGRFLPAREGDLFRLYEGSLVQTRLVNRLDGSFTGPVKCEVVAPVTSVDGKVVLIPKGALFLGEARRVDSQNQRRLAVTFRRLLLPNGYSVDLKNAPGLNGVGETGLSDKVNNHYMQAFGASGAIGVLSGLALYGGRAGAFGFRSGVVSGTGSAATSVLNRYLNVLPTVTIREGHEVNVYISSDLLLPAYKR